MAASGPAEKADAQPEHGERDGIAAGRGIRYFGFFFVFYNIAVSCTTAARASLALSTLPLQTMAVGAVLGTEPAPCCAWHSTMSRLARSCRDHVQLAT